MPESERLLLQSLPPLLRRARVQQLARAGGWSISEIANAFDPPRPRSTIYSWIQSVHALTPTHPAPIPLSPRRRSSPPYDPTCPRLTPSDRARIAELAPLARKYRAGTPSASATARANAELTDLTRNLYTSHGVSIRELATAANVTYNAMKNRVSA